MCLLYLLRYILFVRYIILFSNQLQINRIFRFTIYTSLNQTSLIICKIISFCMAKAKGLKGSEAEQQPLSIFYPSSATPSAIANCQFNLRLLHDTPTKLIQSKPIHAEIIQKDLADCIISVAPIAEYNDYISGSPSFVLRHPINIPEFSGSK